jgi:hypothetical protein
MLSGSSAQVIAIIPSGAKANDFAGILGTG